MANGAEQDIEFVPSDELVEPEPADAEDAAVRPREAEEPMGLMTVEAEEFDAAELAQDVAEELEIEADEAVAAEAESAAREEEHEEDLEEILRRHYGIVSAEPEVEPTRHPTGATEFVCASCYLRKPTGQLADPERSICVDCAASGG
jgi:Domain of unknown function (DUF4193)